MDDATYDLDGDEVSPKPRRPGLPVEPRRLFRILLPKAKRFGLSFLAVSLVSIGAFFFVPKTYKAEAVLVYEGTPLLDPREVRPTPGAFVQSAVVPSRLRELRERLGWDVSLRELDERVEASQQGDDAIVLGGAGPSPEEAFALAQELLAVFLEHQTAFNAERIVRLGAENDAALVRARERSSEAQRAFDAFRARSGTSDVLDEKEQLLKRAAQLRTKEDEAAVEIAAQTATIQELEQAQEELPRQIVATAKKGTPIEAPLAKAKAELAQARATLSEEHPRVLALKQRVATLQAQQRSERSELADQTLMANPARGAVDEQLAKSRAALAAAKERQAALRVLLDDIQKESEALAPAEGEARRVAAELDAAIARVDSLTARGAALRDASLGPTTGFRMLSLPVLPEQSERSAPLVALLVFLPLLALLVHVGVVLVGSLRRLEVQAPREVAWWGNGPVLGTSVWPRDPAALDAFVDELEDQGVYGAGRTLVVPASEKERDIACSFAMRLADAPWLAAAILDVGDRAKPQETIVTPPPASSPPARSRPPRLSSQGTPSVAHGRAVPHKPTMQGFAAPGVDPTVGGPLVTPAPPSSSSAPGKPSSRPPRKRTVIGLPAVQGSQPIPIEPQPVVGSSAPPPATAPRGSDPQPFRRKRGPHATVRMVVPANTAEHPSAKQDSGSVEEAFLLTRSVSIAPGDAPGAAEPPPAADLPQTQAQSESDAVMRAAVRLLGNEQEEVTELRRSNPPPVSVRQDDLTGVALAWNGPLSGPVLRRAARLAHRVLVVVSSGLNAVDLRQVHKRLGREEGVGYVLVNVDDAYTDVDDRVGSVEEFWHLEREPDA